MPAAMNLPRRILVVSFSYHPLLNPRAFRWTALAEGLSQRHIGVDVVTSWTPGMPRIERRNGVTIHRAGWRWLEDMRDALRRRRTNPGEALKPGRKDHSIRTWLRRLLQAVNVYAWRKLHWPDSTCLWYFAAARTARALSRNQNYDAIVSVSPSFTAVLVGHSALTANPSCRWFLDLGDPFSFLVEAPPNNGRLYSRLNQWTEKAAFNRASGISVTNAATARTYAALFPESAHKIRIIPPLLSTTRPVSGERAFPENAVIRLVYVGTLYKRIREPGFLLSLFAAALKDGTIHGIELHFFGDISGCAQSFGPYEELLGTSLHLHGLVGREEIARVINEAAVLINIGNDTVFQLPSKVVEYASSGKPILNIVRSNQDSSAAFFATYPDRLNFLDCGEPTPEQCKSFIDFISRPRHAVPESVLHAWIAPYTLPNVIDDYLNMMDL